MPHLKLPPINFKDRSGKWSKLIKYLASNDIRNIEFQ